MAEPIRFSAGCTPFSAEERGSTREALQDLFAGRVTTQSAADALVRSFLELESSLEDIFEAGIWDVIVAAARELPEHHNKLVELLVYFSGLPPAKDDKGEQRKVYGERIWQDLPTFGWDMNREWNALVVPSRDGPEREDVISNYTNINKFAALITQTSVPILDYSMYGIWSLRDALEYPINHPRRLDPLECSLPAAAVWIFILGPQVYGWTEEYGRPGRGGPLWQGKPGYCKDRWRLWRRQFGEFARSSDVKEEVRTTARQAELMMEEIESREG